MEFSRPDPNLVSRADVEAYVKSKLTDRPNCTIEYQLAMVFRIRSRMFDNLTIEEFAAAVGERGWSEVLSTFKRMYG